MKGKILTRLEQTHGKLTEIFLTVFITIHSNPVWQSQPLVPDPVYIYISLDKSLNLLTF